jgi:hypothetical protein
MAYHRQDTVANLVGDVLGYMGLEVPLTFFGNPEKTVAQVMRIANTAGQDLMNDPFKWQFLTGEMAIVTVPGVDTYPLPDDWSGFTTDSQWNRTTRLPVLGALQEYEWQMLKARNLAGVTFTQLFRVDNGFVQFAEAPTAVQTIIMPYTSRGWLVDGVGGILRYDEITADTDIVLFENTLFKAKLRHMWREEKGFDTVKSGAALDRAMANAKANDTPGRTLSLAQPTGYPYLGVINVPQTGFGF